MARTISRPVCRPVNARSVAALTDAGTGRTYLDAMEIKRPLITALALAALAATPTFAASSGPLKNVPRSAMQVSEGALGTYGHQGQVRTRDAAMRAVVRDHGRHADRARLSFQLLGPSTTTSALGSGLVRQQIGLKLMASDPCNLVYVMWHNVPTQEIEIQVKSNPGQTTSAQCGNAGYHTIAAVPLTSPVSLTRSHALEARVLPAADGGADLTVFADKVVVWQGELPAALVANLSGPAGVRSDNGDYAFRLSTGH
jgi:hypothetical protein